MTKKKRSIQEAVTAAEPIAIEETAFVDDLKEGLEEVKTFSGVIGYILRNSSSASIDLKDPMRIIDYAILSSSAFDASKQFSELFDLGEVKEVIVEGKDAKMLCLDIAGNKISVFMDKNADSDRVLKRLHSC
jgi:predicted regulator of Ras-like GTPase activity (Roadblock/LC7/MglB family)